MPVDKIKTYISGILLCAALSIAAYVLTKIEILIVGRAYIETLVIAILLGAVFRTLCGLNPKFQPGVSFCAKFLLELAVCLLGATLSFVTVTAAGLPLFIGVVLIVFTALGFGYAWGRFLKLPHKMALLVAAGNAICGNSAIAAIAPVIGAESEDVASSIAFTAILGVIVILTLPLVIPLLHLDQHQYGALAGMTVYAVPQVLAATAPVGLQATQMGTLVKLLRVLMLGPVVLGISVFSRSTQKSSLPYGKIVPWFIIGFIVLMTARSLNLIPDVLLPPIMQIATLLTLLAMSALGLGVDLNQMRRVGSRVTMAVCGSLLLLSLLGLVLINIVL